VILERVEVAVKVVAAILTTTDLTDRHRPNPGVAASVHGAGGIDLSQREQAARAPGQS
jgi:hypothetical protein